MKALIPLSYLNEACFLSLNTDDKKYMIALKLAQKQLKQIIGDSFYNQIESAFPNGTLSTDNDTFYEEYVKDYLAWSTYFNYIGFSQSDSTPTGIRQFNDENSTILDDVKLYAYEKKVRENMMIYKNEMINFLTLEQSKDSTKYPLYTKQCSNDFQFGISSIDKESDTYVTINKAVISNS